MPTLTTLGIRAETTLILAEQTTARLHGSAGWRHVFADTSTSTSTFASHGDAFTVAGVPVAKEVLVLDAGLDIDLAPSATLGVSYGGRFGSGFSDQSLKANLSVEF